MKAVVITNAEGKFWYEGRCVWVNEIHRASLFADGPAAKARFGELEPGILREVSIEFIGEGSKIN